MAGTSSPTPGSSHSPTSPNAHAHAHFQRDSLNSNGHSDDGSLFSHLPTIDASDLNITDRDRSSQTPRSKIGTSGASFERNNDFDWDEWEKAMENQTKGWNEENRPEENAFQEVMRKKEDDQEEDAEEIWLDALDQQENVQSQQSTEQDEKENAEFTIGELEDLLCQATEFKQQGNTHFTSSPPSLDKAMSCYKTALDHLPITSFTRARAPARSPTSGPPDLSQSPVPLIPDQPGIFELSEEQAEAIEKEEEAKILKAAEDAQPDVKARRKVESEIEDLKKVIWANLGAIHVKNGNDKEAANACSEALKIDPDYVKALFRRGEANERIGTWTSLTQAQEDYNRLITILPSPSSAMTRHARQALLRLPTKIGEQQNKEKDEMFGKLKELGDGILGKFGMSTDNFKFDPQPGGGYSMRFER